MDSNWNKIPARYVALLVQHLEHEGLDCGPALKRAGVQRASLQHSEAVLPAELVAEAFRMLAQASQRSGLGLSIGGLVGVGQLGEVGRAMMACSTLGDAVTCCMRYFELVTPSFVMQVRTVDSHAELSWAPVRAVPYDLLVVGYDIALMAVHNQLTRLLREDLPSYDAYFSTPAPSYVDQYRAIRPGRCHFDQGGLPKLRIVIDADVLKTPMPMANAADLAEAELRLLARLRSSPQHRDWKAWVLLMLRESLDHQPTQDELAALLNVSASTLARRLAAQACSFRDLSMTVRHERACELLARGSSSVADIALRLGYSHAASFIRAFKLQTGMTPQQYTQQGKGSPR